MRAIDELRPHRPVFKGSYWRCGSLCCLIPALWVKPASATASRRRPVQARIDSLMARAVEVIVPEVADYEVRRELTRINAVGSLRRLDYSSRSRLSYHPSSTPHGAKPPSFGQTPASSAFQPRRPMPLTPTSSWQRVRPRSVIPVISSRGDEQRRPPRPLLRRPAVDDHCLKSRSIATPLRQPETLARRCPELHSSSVAQTSRNSSGQYRSGKIMTTSVSSGQISSGKYPAARKPSGRCDG